MHIAHGQVVIDLIPVTLLCQQDHHFVLGGGFQNFAAEGGRGTHPQGSGVYKSNALNAVTLCGIGRQGKDCTQEHHGQEKTDHSFGKLHMEPPFCSGKSNKYRYLCKTQEAATNLARADSERLFTG